MKKNNLIFAFYVSISALLFTSCGGTSDSKTDETKTDSLVSQNVEFNEEIKKITFEIFADSGTIELAAGEEDSPGALFKEQILVVKEVPKVTNFEAIKAILEKYQDYTGDAKQALAKKKKEYLEGYVEMNSEEVMGMSADWERDLTVNVVYNDNYFTTIGFYLDEYGGGARSYYTEGYLILDLKNSKQIKLSDMFDENGVSKLTQKLTNKALETAKKEGYTSLDDAGFLVEKIEPTEKFLINGQGIEFTYNRADITVNSMPPPSFFLTWNEVEDIMKTDASVRSLIK